MNDAELRALVKAAVARHLGSSGAPAARSAGGASGVGVSSVGSAPVASGPHASHVMYRIINVGDSCVIEPSVTCDHCGYCKSHGH